LKEQVVKTFDKTIGKAVGKIVSKTIGKAVGKIVRKTIGKAVGKIVGKTDKGRNKKPMKQEWATVTRREAKRSPSSRSNCDVTSFPCNQILQNFIVRTDQQTDRPTDQPT
jgi:hypothetical protein